MHNQPTHPSVNAEQVTPPICVQMCARDDLLALAALAAPDAEQHGYFSVENTVDKRLFALKEVLVKLFSSPQEKKHLTYDYELTALSKGLGKQACSMLKNALDSLGSTATKIVWNEDGQINLKKSVLSDDLREVLALAIKHVELHVFGTFQNVVESKLGLSSFFRQDLRKVLQTGEIPVLMLVKEPPFSASQRIMEITKIELAGMSSLLADPAFIKSLKQDTQLGSYLNSATVRVLCTGNNAQVREVAKRLNKTLEQQGGFEEKHLIRVTKSVALGEKQEALGGALKVCIPVIGGVFALHHLAPHLMNIVGGVLDDIFGAVVPNVSQSWGPKEAPFMKKVQNALPMLKGGAVGVAASFGFGIATSLLYAGGSASPGLRVAAGISFALACSAGTIGSCIAAFKGSLDSIKQLAKNPKFAESLKDLSTREKFALAFRESVLDSPFRIGHVLIGVPAQLLLGVAAGLGGFLSNGLFVAAEGMLETAFGITTAYLYPKISHHFHRARLKEVLRD